MLTRVGYSGLIITILAGVLLFFRPATEAEARHDTLPSPTSTYAARVDDAARVVELVNRERRRVGLSPLAVHLSLTQAAQSYAEILAGGTCFGHSCGPVPNLSDRVERAGYTNWSTLGENVAAGYRTPEAVVTGWMSSSGHRANILSRSYRETGVGVAYGGRYGVYWVQVFGARRG